ncbi:ATP-grasp superfamily enzyme [Halalkaliarchaeum desulfuricum]|uniref:ATP-grasp superfamily enzyme n=1 Tax=Halalkaliarchaeum desulfuricum TaxID=2055893 RepID=A0A343TNV0_9EURY|nr:PAC2 family protein [Halalkaliarchaeum desulfuricum]AUX10772.1 ATP-grasp superfamily enzyme [Halalkaliarchaeum desulfuricum]
MTGDDSTAHYDRTKELATDSPTLIEGLPGLGLVASIAVDQITKQLELEQHGTIRSDEFPPVASFNDGRVRDTVRVYAGKDPDVMTLQSDVPIPPNAVECLSKCVLTDLAEDFEKAVFLAGAPAETETEIGEIVGVATTDELETDLVDAGIPLAEGAGVIGGITGGLLASCYHNDIPASVLVVRSHPYIPDPGAAREVVENALEPLVDFDIDTQELLEQAEEIQRQKQQIAQQLQQYQQQQQEQQPQTSGMFQ